jgi:hypothetical protein
MTHYLRFPDKATGMAALTEAGFTDAEGTVLTASHTHALDVVGVITIGGDTPTVLDGWHVNYIGELPEDWASYVVTPEQPVRVFAG